MNEQPTRRQATARWFRFRLSTVLILTAIAAWAMATRPFVMLVEPNAPKSVYRWITIPWGTIFVEVQRSPGVVDCMRFEKVLNPQLVLVAVIFAAFLAWKAAWAVVERRRRSARATPPGRPLH
ncbi:MAG: hypothetical protein K2Y37_11965 [Pirellulales bacterium]|nr:hypothetical protein [Pirellulales bacterium]